MTIKGLLASLLAMIVLATGCARDELTGLHVGSKDFTEQHILAEMIALVAENEGIPVKRSIPYPAVTLNLEYVEALKNGDLDVYPEYNGTGLVQLGQPPIGDGNEATFRVKQLFEPLGLKWLDRFGFSNDYVLVMHKDRATAMGVKKISDLAKLGGVRFATEADFIQRPLDGLGPLLRRYGLKKGDSFVADKDRFDVYQALLDERADVAEGYGTDGHIDDYGLVVLKDDLKFFPIYQPAPLVRADALERFPKLEPALKKMAGVISTADMRKMVSEVDLAGQDYRLVATAFLVRNELITGDATTQTQKLHVAAGILDQTGRTTGTARRAVRNAFPGRDVRVFISSAPLSAVTGGTARVALVSTEAFYDLQDGTPVRNESVEALGVVGFKMAHLVTKTGGPSRLQDMRNLGVGPPGGSSHRSADMILTSMGLKEKIRTLAAPHGSLAEQVAQLRDGKIDGLFLMLPPGDKTMTDIMTRGGLKLAAIQDWKSGNNLIRFPFFRLAQLPAGTYPGQTRSIETISAQLVLAGPAPTETLVGDAGPGTGGGGTTPVQALSDETVIKLTDVLGTVEKVDPVLPRAAALRPKTSTPSLPSINQPDISFVNLLAVGLLVYMLVLYMRPQGPMPAGSGVSRKKEGSTKKKKG